MSQLERVSHGVPECLYVSLSLSLSLHPCSCIMGFQTKKHYERAFKEAEKAQEAFKKADADIHLSRADVEKVWYFLGRPNDSMVEQD